MAKRPIPLKKKKKKIETSTKGYIGSSSLFLYTFYEKHLRSHVTRCELGFRSLKHHRPNPSEPTVDPAPVHIFTKHNIPSNTHFSQFCGLSIVSYTNCLWKERLLSIAYKILSFFFTFNTQYPILDVGK